jgi:hypothetical protein
MVKKWKERVHKEHMWQSLRENQAQFITVCSQVTNLVPEENENSLPSDGIKLFMKTQTLPRCFLPLYTASLRN